MLELSADSSVPEASPPRCCAIRRLKQIEFFKLVSAGYLYKSSTSSYSKLVIKKYIFREIDNYNQTVSSSLHLKIPEYASCDRCKQVFFLNNLNANGCRSELNSIPLQFAYTKA